jgi:hypothetical protein
MEHAADGRVDAVLRTLTSMLALADKNRQVCVGQVHASLVRFRAVPPRSCIGTEFMRFSYACIMQQAVYVCLLCDQASIAGMKPSDSKHPPNQRAQICVELVDEQTFARVLSSFRSKHCGMHKSVELCLYNAAWSTVHSARAVHEFAEQLMSIMRAHRCDVLTRAVTINHVNPVRDNCEYVC